MRLAVDRVKKLCAGRGLNLTALLREAKVSRNAYYTLSRKPSVLPKSIRNLAAALEVKPSAFLKVRETPSDEARSLIEQIDRIEHRFKIHDRDNVRHTLLLLREKPIDRLRRALIRAQKPDIY
jgi:transcriptional regulator with XRE-family HTH domain